VRIRHVDGLTLYVRHDVEQPGVGGGTLRNLERLHGFTVPSHLPSYAAPVVTDFWEGSEEPEAFARWWAATESGPAWEQGSTD
jgi:hypothetical protein